MLVDLVQHGLAIINLSVIALLIFTVHKQQVLPFPNKQKFLLTINTTQQEKIFTSYMIFNLLLNFQFWFVLATRVIPMRILIKFDLNINLIHQVYKMLVEARRTRRSKVPIRVQSESSSALLTDHRPSVVF